MRATSLLLCALVCAALLTPARALGTLYINQIYGNRNSNTVQVAQVLFTNSSLSLDSLSPTTAGQPLSIYSTAFNGGSIHIGAGGSLTLSGQLAALSLVGVQGGVALQLPGAAVAFTAANGTGDAYIAGTLSVAGAFSAAAGAFSVQAVTGDVTTAGPLTVYGTVAVGALFNVSSVDGTTTAAGFVRVGAGGLLLGSAAPDTQTIAVFTGAVPTAGSPLVISAQSGSSGGGSLVLQPGFATDARVAQAAGSVLFGRDFPDSLALTRAAIAAGNAAVTQLAGQDAGRDGGDLIVTAGSGGSGGALYLVPGCGASACGSVLLGPPATSSLPPFPLAIGRPALSGGQAGSATIIAGQSALDGGNGGDLWLEAGDGVSGGAVVIDAANVWLADSTPTALLVGRLSTNSEAGNGWTIIRGSDSLLGNGGALAVRAGDAAVANNANGAGGQLWLWPGADSTPASLGSIYLGIADDPLTIVRPPAAPGDNGLATTVAGGSALGAGGALLLQSGASATVSGDISLSAGSASAGTGGSVTIAASQATSAAQAPSTGAGVTLTAGAYGLALIAGGAGAVGGSLNLAGGLALGGNPNGTNNGQVNLNGASIVFQQTNVLLTQDPLAVATLNIVNATGSASLTLSTNAQLNAGVVQLTYGGQTQRLLRGRQPTFIDSPLTQAWQSPQQASAEAVRVYNRILLALASHGLVSVTFVEGALGPFEGFSLNL